MLTGLDQVNWRKYRHAYGSAENLPNLLLTLFDDWDAEEEQSFEDLGNYINHQGDIYDATAQTIPFLIQALNIPSANREYVFFLLISLAQSCYVVLPKKLGELSAEIATYQAICQGIDTYLAYLSNPDPEMRQLALTLLQELTDHQNYIRPRLRQVCQQETNPMVAAEMIYSLGFFIPKPSMKPSWRAVRNSYTLLFENLAQSHPEEIIRIAAASAWSVMQPNWQGVVQKPEEKAFILQTLGKAFAKTTLPAQQNTWSNVFLQDAVLYDNIVKLGVYALAYILMLDELSPLKCHQIAQSLLDAAFSGHAPRPRTQNKLYQWLEYEHGIDKKNPTEYYYRLGNYSKVFQPAKPLNHHQKFVIQKIVECDRFWELPTNLFSFFYGLPDSREELRQLVEQSTS